MSTDYAEVIEREVQASPHSFIGGVRVDLRWDGDKFADLCAALHVAARVHRDDDRLPRAISQVLWYCATLLPMWLRQRDFTVGQPAVDYDRALKLMRRLGDEWFGVDSILPDDEVAREADAFRSTSHSG
jgi:hypothetical protein